MRITPKRRAAGVGAAAVALLLTCGGAATATPLSAEPTAAPVAARYKTMAVASVHGASVYAGPSSDARKFRKYPLGTALKIQCQTTKTPSGRLWYRLYNHIPTSWVHSSHFASPVHPPKECYP
ncbi:SH3 domain-containing protein [Streptomyces sp. NPDC048611]|uniref:SH3 domain-containing protein n=1 Tax=unclassified Streptomyces TaxID=2593676 RepID=UPI0034407B3B